MALILAVSAILLRYRREINSWYKTRERNKAERIGKELGLPMKIKLGKAQRIYPSRIGLIPPKWSYIKTKNIEIYCKGMGTKADPFIIDGLFPIPKRVLIFNDNRYYLLKNLKSKKIGLEGCENFTFKNCEFKEFRLKKCANIIIQDTLLVRECRLKDCQNIAFENCLIKNVVLYKSNVGFFKNCFFIHLKDWMSRNNTYESNIIEFLESNKKEVSFSKGNTLKDIKIKESNYKMKKIFYITLKTELPLILWTIFFASFSFIGMFTLFGLRALGYDIWYWYLIIPGNFAYFILIAIVAFYLNEFYFKIILKRKK